MHGATSSSAPSFDPFSRTFCSSNIKLLPASDKKWFIKAERGINLEFFRLLESPSVESIEKTQYNRKDQSMGKSFEGLNCQLLAGAPCVLDFSILIAVEGSGQRASRPPIYGGSGGESWRGPCPAPINKKGSEGLPIDPDGRKRSETRADCHMHRTPSNKSQLAPRRGSWPGPNVPWPIACQILERAAFIAIF